MASRATLLAAMAAVVVAALLPATASAASYRVGDDSGWDNGVDYNAWASGKKFKVGDTLEFLYAKGSHKRDAAPGNAPTLASGDDRVALRQARQWFFICGVEGHCQSGMKLVVNVH